VTQKILQSDPGRSATSLQTLIAANLRYYMATLSLYTSINLKNNV
jgi:hypothetical protein